MYINTDCKLCNGDGIVQAAMTGENREGYLEEYYPCPDCQKHYISLIAEVVKLNAANKRVAE